MTSAPVAAERPWFAPFSPGARRFLTVVAILFVTAVACRLNGTSISYWSASFIKDFNPRDAPSGLLLSRPKVFRGDEWNVWTPAMLNQARAHFPVHNATLGPGATPLLMSLPAWHYTMLFRPQLWGFFGLPFDFAFSWYWNVKLFGVFAAMFLLGWALSGGHLIASIFGAVALVGSHHLQWWFSTPAMLPEMLACWALGLLAAMSLFASGGWGHRALAACALVFCGVNFALACYPAFQIPLAHLGIFVLAGYLWQHRLFSWRGALWLAGALAVTALALLPWLLECLPALRIVAHTVYPGQRHVNGGDTSLLLYFSGLLNLAIGEKRCPPELITINEAANYYPLWLLPLGLGAASLWRCAAAGRRAWLTQRGIKVALAAYLLGVSCYMFVPLFPWLASATLLDRSYGRRCLIGIGLAGILLVAQSVASGSPLRLTARQKWVAGLAWSLGVGAFLWKVGMEQSAFFGPGALAGLGAVAGFLGVIYLAAPPWALLASWVAIFVVQTAPINPLCVGLPELLESPALDRLAALARAEPQAQWAFYDGVIGSELLKSTGAAVINGLRIIPDPELIAKFDPAGQFRDSLNRYSHLCLIPEPYESPVTIELKHHVFVEIHIHPRRLREMFPALEYIVSVRPEPEFEEAGFALLDHREANCLWLYRRR